MQAWQDFVQRSNGDAVPNAFIVVHTWPADVLATIYSTNSTSTPITSQLRADANGQYEFYAPNGRYMVYITGDSIEQQTREIILLDPNDGFSPAITGGTITGASIDVPSLERSGKDAAIYSVDSSNNIVGLLGPTNVQTKLLSLVAKKSPSPSLGGSTMLLTDVTVINGTWTLTTGPNGMPALKCVTTAGGTGEITFNGLANSYFQGDAYVVGYGDYPTNNVDYMTFYTSNTDASYTNGSSNLLQYGFSTSNNSFEQGGTSTYYFRKGGISNIGTGPSYPQLIGAAKLRINARAAQVATFYLYGVALAAPQQKGRICVTFDDGYDSFFKLGYDSFSSRGIPLTYSAIGSMLDSGGGYAYKRQVQAFFEAGNAIVPHGPYLLTDPTSQSSNIVDLYPIAANALSDVVASRDFIASQGWAVDGYDKCYVWPQGKYQASYGNTAYLDALIGSGFTLGRVTTPLIGTPYGSGINVDSQSKYNKMANGIIGHTWAGNTAAEATNITNITTAISALSTSKTDAFLMLHKVLPSSTSDGSMGSAGSITIRKSDLETIAASIASGIAAGTLEAVTMPQMAARTWWMQ